ncbi:MAG TPA: ABC transporter ATP-binding protein [Actinomycetota bacterium]|nr:ABC transporter ATP-binding protein [Actinomycetota bacterium]
MAFLEIRDLSVGYGSLPVIQSLSLDIEEGETAVLLGLNGAGKTTTVMAIAGMLKPWGGSILLDGTDITGADPRKLVAQGIVLVPEGRRVFPQLTIAQNLRLGAWPYRKDRKATRPVLEQALEYFPRLRERWGQLAGTLSGGEQQMLAIARGLMARPKILLIDEASLGLSPKLTQTVFEVVDRINDAGTTVLLVEQNAGALAIADRAFIIEKGELVYTGHGDEILDSQGLRQAYLGAPV